MNIDTLCAISYGLYIVSSKSDDKFNGQIVDALMQVTSEPPTITACINKKNLTCEYIKESGIFSVSILAKTAPLRFIGTFGFKSGRDVDKFKECNFKIGISGVPIVLDNSMGYLEAEVVNTVDVGTHLLFIAKVIDAQVINDEEPMTYAYYHNVKRGTTSEAAPTYIKKETKKEEKEDAKV